MSGAALRAALGAALTAFLPTVLAAQVCAGHTIGDIRIRTAGLFDGDRRVPGWVEHVASALSWRTRPEVVSNDLLFNRGEPCDAHRLKETERLLRLRPYLRSAVIRSVTRGDSVVDLDVDTRDDWSLGGDISVSTSEGGQLRSARLTETNLLGYGVLGRVRYDNRGRQPGVQLDLLHRHLIGNNHVEMIAGRTSVGPVWSVAVFRPFETEYDFTGWFAGISRIEEPFGMHADTLGGVTVPRLREAFGINSEWRVGPEGLQMLGGFSVMHTRVRQSDPAFASDPADDSLAQASVAGLFREVRRFAINVTAGARSIRRVAHSRLDAVNAVEDVREGLEVRVTAGRGLEVGGLPPDWFALAEGYAGVHVGRTLLFVRSRAEGLRLRGASRWHDLLVSGDVFTYSPVRRRGVMVMAARAAGGWRMRQPFQLSLGEGEGMRGFGRGTAVGRRLVTHGEYRHYAGTVRGIGDIGWAAFVDAGRGWAGDAPFARDHSWRASVGGGLRFAFPPGSKYVARMDLAVPLDGGPVELRFATRQQFSILRPEPGDVRRSRQAVSTQPPFNSFPY